MLYYTGSDHDGGIGVDDYGPYVGANVNRKQLQEEFKTPVVQTQSPKA